ARGLAHAPPRVVLRVAGRRRIERRAPTTADQPLDLEGATALLAGRCLAARALGGGAWQHAVFSRDPAARLPLEPRRQPVLERRRHQHVGVAELHEAGTLGVFHHAALARDGAQLVGLSWARPHAGLLPGVLGELLGASAATDKRARGSACMPRVSEFDALDDLDEIARRAGLKSR